MWYTAGVLATPPTVQPPTTQPPAGSLSATAKHAGGAGSASFQPAPLLGPLQTTSAAHAILPALTGGDLAPYDTAEETVRMKVCNMLQLEALEG